MSLFVEGMKCPLCNEPMLSSEPLFGTWGVWLPSSNPLERYCDATMHWSCYANWKHQARFARSYFEAWVRAQGHNPYWKPAFVDDSVLVEVNPTPPVEAAWVYVAATGTRHNPKLEDWSTWLHASQDEHPLEHAALSAIKRKLINHVPTKESLLACIST